MGENEDAPATVVGQQRFKPPPLPVLRRKARVHDHPVHHHEQAVLVFKGMVLGLKVPFVLGNHVVVDRQLCILVCQGVTGKGLLANVMVAGNEMERTLEFLEDPMEPLGRFLIGRRAGSRMRDVPQVDHEVRGPGD